MNVARWGLSVIAGCSAALIAFGVIYVRGDLGGVMRFLKARRILRETIASGAGAAEVAAAKAQALAVAQGFAVPDVAVGLVPLELLIGLLVGVLVWWLFGRRVGRALDGQERPDVQERMVYRLAHRKGGHFTLADLSAGSPLTPAQAQAVTRHMVQTGRLLNESDGVFRLTAHARPGMRRSL
ncbi:hypothetical protein [Deinococcus aquatilis]|uniref:hypothetical protein n=1 Tax=Deinococcus aquatilis TaxID=519440 RepID=UPI00036C474A|nr:hypothetical protein [Deinococcus aquatilis]